MSAPDVYEVFAIRYATSPHRKRFHNCLMHKPGDIHDAPMPMDFFVWLIRNQHRTIVVDAGSKDWNCRQRGHEYIRSPIDGLEAIGVDCGKVDDLILTHMHWDHAGNIDGFGDARIHLQLDEMRNVTGPTMADPTINSFFQVDDVCTVVRRLFAGRVLFHEAASEIASGVSVHRVGGHSAGMQVVRVNTTRGWVVLAADASHFYLNFKERNPFPVLYNFAETVQGWDRCAELADSLDHIIPGHDPAVVELYPSLSGFAGDVVRLDRDPSGQGEV